MLIDTHAHLDFPDYNEDRTEVLQRAGEAGVNRIITIGTTLESSRRAIELAEQHEQVYATVGIHPNNATETPDDFLETLRELAAHPKVVALGEMGLDYHRLEDNVKPDLQTQATSALLAGRTEDLEHIVEDGAIKARQAAFFGAQLDLAVDLDLPVVIHQRDSWQDVLDQLEPYTGKVRGVFHCFGGSPDDVKLLADRGHIVSFTGIVTFKSAQIVREAAAAVADDGFMVETDCPFLAPVPHRGQRCEPAYVAKTAAAISEARGVSPEKVAELTSRTAERFFRFSR